MTQQQTPRRLLLEDARAEAAARAADQPPGAAQINLGRALLGHPAGVAILRLLGALFGSGTLPNRLRELLTMRVAWLTGSEYEWGQHWTIAQGLGVPAEDLAALRDWHAHPNFDARDRAVLMATDEIVATGTMSDAAWNACTRALDDRDQAAELVIAVAAWQMLSSVLRTLEVPLDGDRERWPPDGVGPERLRG